MWAQTHQNRREEPSSVTNSARINKENWEKEGESGGGNDYMCLLCSFQLRDLFYLFVYVLKGLDWSFQLL